MLPQFSNFYQKGPAVISCHQYGVPCLATKLWKVLTASLVTNTSQYTQFKGGPGVVMLLEGEVWVHGGGRFTWGHIAKELNIPN